MTLVLFGPPHPGPPFLATLLATLLTVIGGGLITYLVTRLIERSKRLNERDRTLVHILAELKVANNHYARSIKAVLEFPQIEAWQKRLRLQSSKYYGTDFGSLQLSALANLESADAAEIARFRLNTRNSDVHIDMALESLNGPPDVLERILDQLVGRFQQIEKRAEELQAHMTYAKPPVIFGFRVAGRSRRPAPAPPTPFR